MKQGTLNEPPYQVALPHIESNDGILESPKQDTNTMTDKTKHTGTDSQEKRLIDNFSVRSNELFEEGKDDIIMEGELMKFKPGLSQNFIPRYVQISKRAFRYFKS